MNLYSVLGVKENAEKQEIKAAYRKAAKRYHPDKESGNTEKFNLVNKAYSILIDDTKRAQYDKTGDTEKRRLSWR